MKENMSDKKLGRGLSALFGESKMQKDLPTPGSGNNEANSVQLISINKIIAGIYQPRIHFNQSELEELADSIKENGLIQPIILRKADEDDQYEIIAGERRFRACKIAGLSEIPAIVKKLTIMKP
jgi:ParB family chromosome partitioning protein